MGTPEYGDTSVLVHPGPWETFLFTGSLGHRTFRCLCFIIGITQISKSSETTLPRK